MLRKLPAKITPVDDDDDDNDDSISLNSTEGSQYSATHEFEVERVLAEKADDGKKLYLLRWNGYPLDRSTWEPRDNIFDDKILADWEEMKIRESRGIVQPFNVEKFDAEVERLADEKAKRHRRRKLKRRLCGLPISETDSESGYPIASDSESAEEDIGAEDKQNGERGLKGTYDSPPQPRKQPEIPVVRDQGAIGPNSNRKRPLSTSSLDKPLSSFRRQRSEKFTASSDSDEPLASRGSNAAAVRTNPSICATYNSNASPKPCPSSLKLDEPTIAVVRGKGASRGGSASHKNVFEVRNPLRKRPTLLQTSSDPTKDKKHFKNMHLLRKAELASRALEDAAPDINAVGGLFKPGEPSTFRGVNPSSLRRNSAISGTPQDQNPVEESSPFQLDTLSCTRETGQALSTPAATVQKSYSEIPVCYYWNLKGNCSNGYQCKYKHYREPGVPVAPRPPDKRDSSRVPTSVKDTNLSYSASRNGLVLENAPSTRAGQESQYQSPLQNDMPVQPALKGSRVDSKKHGEICWFWYTRGVCSKGELCMFHHANSQSMPLAPDPTRPAHAPVPQYEPSEELLLRQAGYKGANPTSPNPKPEVCKHWKRGDCYHGSKCWFAHETPYGAESEPPYQAPGITQPSNHPPLSAIAPQDASDSVISAIQEEDQPDHAKHKSLESVPAVLPLRQPNSRHDGTQPAIAESTSATPVSIIASTTKHNKTSIEGYRRNQAAKALEARVKMVTFGGNDQQPLLFDTGDAGTEAQHPLHQLFTTLSHIKFNQICIAQDFASQQSALQRHAIWDGSLCPVDTGDSQEANIIDNIVQDLRLRASGLICVTAPFVILTYPARAEEWRFLDYSSYPKEVRLRYLVFQTDLNVNSCLVAPVKEVVGLHPPYRKALMDKIYGLSVDNLIPLLDKAHNTYNFYLLFPPTANKTASFITQWLRSFGLGCNIYNSETEGSWDFVVKTPTFVACAVLVHESVAAEIYRLPLLQELLRKSKKAFTFWYISDSSPRFSIFPSIFDLDLSNVGRMTATRLFPHGAIIFLTPSFLVAEPERTYELLKWFFNKKLDSVTPGTWKLACCYNVTDYLLDLANAKAFERQRFYEENYDKPSKDAEANQRGLGFESCQLRYKIHVFLTSALHSRNSSRRACCDDYPSIFDEVESPIIHSDKYIDADDEQAQIEWFAGWAMRRLDLFRKFTVIGTGPGSVMKSTRLKKLPVMTTNPTLSFSGPSTFVREDLPSQPAAGSLTGDRMEIDSGPVGMTLFSAGSESEDETEAEWKPVDFESTTSWYKRLKANGASWEHVTVDSWEQCWSYLGIGKK